MDISGKPTVISTFAGTGGSSLGYKWAGFHELLAIDFDPHAVACFRANFPDVPIWLRDIKTVTSKEILDSCKIKQGELDVFDGSPPCQGFSTAGKREVTDPRNDLFVHYVRLVNELQPKIFVMENVSGMVKGKMKGKFLEILSTLKNLNYVVKCKQLNAMYYGVPQSRERVFFIGVRKDLNKTPEFPKPSTKLITTFDVCPNVKSQSRGQFDKKFVSSKRPAYTVTKTASMIFEYQDGSKLRPRISEMLKITSFPEEWKLPGKFEEQWARLGNAVMPKQMQAIAETLIAKVLKLSNH